MKKMIGVLFCGVMMGAASLMAQENLLKNNDFSKENGWSVWTEADAISAGTTSTFEGNKFAVTIPAGVKKVTHSVQLMNSVYLEDGKTYELTFTATTAKAGSINVVYLYSKAPWTQFANVEVKIAAGTAEYKCNITPKKVGDKYEKPLSIRFFFGNLVDNNITIEKISLTEVK